MSSKKISPKERAEIARKCEIGDQYLYQVISGRRIPSGVLASKIEKASGGVLSRKDLRPSDWADLWPELAEQKAAA